MIRFIAWLVSAGYVAAFLWLTALAQKRAERSVWLFHAPGQTLSAWGFRLGFVAMVIWPLFHGFGGGALWIILAAIGAGLALWAQLHMGASWRIGAAQGAIGRLVIDGPFRLSRNPVFVGQILLAWALIPVAGWIMVAAALLITGAASIQIHREEELLRRDPAWRDYARRTPRWLGLPRRD
ncbi:methyltransferase family protein [Paracoccus sediminicola]|uniref:methyltransferase family protein n=1 Tax=Paracoccus sediminicola TaxID=3017783 RepID=UPI0022F064FA|nr:methyltransferase [Paracoccus sediminicola]WBU58243.1 methyltransferase [Paracoccus sediminicola]